MTRSWKQNAHRVEDDGGGVAPFLRDDFDAVALTPDGELLARRRAEGVPGGQEHGLAALGEKLRELSDRGGLPGAVHAHHHDDEGLLTVEVEVGFGRAEHRDDFVAQRQAHLVLGLQTAQFNRIAQTL